MGLYIENEFNYQFDFDLETIGSQVVKATLDFENCPYEADVGLLLTNDESIQKLNTEYRNIHKPTDVLSFPINDRTRIVDLFSTCDLSNSFIEDAEDEQSNEDLSEEQIRLISSFDPDSGRLILGDIVISVDTLIRQAGEFGHSIKREYAFLIVHSMLHLLGYDHLEEAEREIMEEKQEEILSILKIAR